MIMPLTQKISIVLSDVDGTLVDSKKRITERAKAAIQNLSGAGIKFTVASARSPRAMMMVVDQITVSAPFAAFNGGILVEPGTMKVLIGYLLYAL
jgi:HAD superfamily hydrolase (TIGR01484 family)